uniref:Uncharacterized protein n=2 Tax=Moniliophthora roreri TaxID=221103 RepID=A0A0W0G279_MONRR
MRKSRTRPSSTKKTTIYYGEEVVVKGERVDKITRPLIKKPEQWTVENAEYESMIRAMSWGVREEVVDLVEDTQMVDLDPSFNPTNNDSDDDERHPVLDVLNSIPLGEEGAMSSHAGGEFEYHSLLSSLLSHSSQRDDDRTRTDRVAKQVQSWAEQRSRHINAYLEFQAFGAPTIMEGADCWLIRTMDWNFFGERKLFHTPESQSINESLLRHGFLGGSAEQPTIAFSLSFLEQYRQIHRVCPKYSIDTFARSLQHIHRIPRDGHLEDQLRTSYDAYLAIMREIHNLTVYYLGRDERMLYDEILCPLLREDPQKLYECRWLEDAEVNEFANEVRNAQKKGKKKQSAAPEDVEGYVDTDIPMLSADETDELKSSVDDVAVAYDIMCAFFKTLRRSAKLRDKVIESRLIGVVPAFHGHAHNRKCQVNWHPQYTNGVGLEDFEECERTFALSNGLASTTRLTTPFHRRQAIQEHFSFHDDDKHATSGNFIYQNYRQALGRLARERPLLEEMCAQRGITRLDCEGFLEREREHFNRDFKHPPEVTVELDYAELLQKLWAAEKESVEAREKYNALNTPEGRLLLSSEQTRIRVQNRTTLKRHQLIEEEVADFEIEHGIEERWKEHSKHYKNALTGLAEREYHRALDKLEHLVVQRLFELTKLNSSEICYSQRTQISNALKSRSGAIRTALKSFNKAAEQIGRQQLQIEEVLKMVALVDFDVLKDSHIDITQLAWTKPENRKMMQYHFSIKRAEEEIRCLNVEIRRLITFMLDDNADYLAAYRLAIHERLAEKLVQTSKLNGFTGNLLPGQRINRDSSITDSVPLPDWATSVLGLRLADDGASTTTARQGRDLPSEPEDEPVLRLDKEAYDNGILEFMQRLTLDDSDDEDEAEFF